MIAFLHFCIFACFLQLYVTGPHAVPKLPIFSLVVQHRDSGRFLHHNYVSSVLNDVFGIQSRGGCMCAGPYAQVFKYSYTTIEMFGVHLCTRDSVLCTCVSIFTNQIMIVTRA